MTYEKKSVIELREIAKEYKKSGQRRKSTWDSGSYARRVWFHPM